MSYLEDKFEFVIFTLALLLFSALVYVAKAPQHLKATGGDEVVSEMPRPRSFWANLFGIGLEDREIQRKYINPFDVKKGVDKKNIVKAGEIANQASTAKPKQDLKKTAGSEDKKPHIAINIVGDDRTGLSDLDMGSKSWSQSKRMHSSASSRITSEEDKSKASDKNKLSADQWRSLLLGQPTKENMAKFINAYSSLEVDESTFYLITNELLHDPKSDLQLLGLSAASSFYTSNSFSTVASVFDQLNADNQSKAQAFLMSFSTSQRSNILLGVLKSSNPVVVDLATQVVLKGFHDSSSGSVGIVDPRNSRGDINETANLVSDYQKFIPIFKQLAKGSDPTIADIANSALKQIQTGVAAL
jgi:hypothetical protein